MRRSPFMQVVLALASLQLTVVLMALSIGLVFVGTLAQVDDGIWTVVEKYFRSAFVLVPLQLFFPRDWQGAGRCSRTPAAGSSAASCSST